jgi:tRNA threonylcarbamoyladenosine biosynthesis protein TsaE
MDFPFQTFINSEDDTLNVAKEFSKILKDGDIVALNGDLGSGKTFFVKAVCKEYKIESVNSPTFAIVYEYSGVKNIYHFDFYRIKRMEELYDIGIEDYLNDGEAIVFIEWADLMDEILPKKHYSILITVLEDEKRKLEIVKNE